ncbi:MAG: hypothetical protein KME21_28650 [Desmonostoc vinosum HA7617-LM4]|jgi:hypothetical protein|nr:hypothetical protein [Desmonostoc vinosum HA7617-LM4]
MSVQSIKSELFVELSTKQQQHISGGCRYRKSCQSNNGNDGMQQTPEITVIGQLSTKGGECFPVKIVGFRTDS